MTVSISQYYMKLKTIVTQEQKKFPYTIKLQSAFEI